MLKRTRKCGELTSLEKGKEIVLNGWVDRTRNLGGIIFINLRDRYGRIQAVVSPENLIAYDIANSLRNEDVIALRGIVRDRPEEAVNKENDSGSIELEVKEIEIISRSETPPIYVNISSGTSEEARLKYRYLDLRTERMKNNIILRHRVISSVREYFNSQEFLEIDTPILTKSTPEGARDFLVPARLKLGKFYALPQSPQLFKQLLMISGFDRYYQIAKCFRDEDLRADRQPEFTQIDYEMSFVEEEDVMNITERMLQKVFKDVLDVEIQLPFMKLDYTDAMERFGSDKPDLRFGLELKDLSSLFLNTQFKIISSVLEEGGCVKGIKIHGCAEKFSRKILSELENHAILYGAKGLMNVKLINSEIKASFEKNVDKEILKNIQSVFEMNDNDIVLLIAGKRKKVNSSLGALRLEIAKKEGLIPENIFTFLWVTDFPMFDYSEEEKRFVAQHHPFTMPDENDLSAYSDTDPEKIKAKAYDVVLNGWELGGGSIRIHKNDIQKKVFDLLGLTKKEQEEKFGFFLEAFKYGVPPHGGCALGLDRLVSMIAGEEYIRDVIPFPKTTSGMCLMSEAPSEVFDDQLKVLKLKIDI